MAAPLIASELKMLITASEVRSCWHLCCRRISHSARLSQDKANWRPSFEADRQEFRVYEIGSGSAAKKKFERGGKRPTWLSPPQRSERMRTDQDWTAVWPGARTFNWSVVPLPIRQGFSESTEGSQATGDFGLPPHKYGNTELLKIPNFLHLTPKHIKQQCDAIRKYCTRWPTELKTDEQMKEHFPVEVVTSDYCFSGPSVRDARARTVTLKFKLSDLELDKHAKDKIKGLLKYRYDKTTDMVTLVADRCPLKQQNYDYLQYIMTALYFESWKTEAWESERTKKDMREYVWDISDSKKNVTDLLNVYKDKLKDMDEAKRSQFSHLSGDLTEETVASLDDVKAYKSAVEELKNAGETDETLNNYKQSVINMLKLQKAAVAKQTDTVKTTDQL